MKRKDNPKARRAARRLLQTLNRHAKPGMKQSVMLIGSRAKGTYRINSDIDLLVMPGWKKWPGPEEQERVEKTVSRFQRGKMRQPTIRRSRGSDVGISESYRILPQRAARRPDRKPDAVIFAPDQALLEEVIKETGATRLDRRERRPDRGVAVKLKSAECYATNRLTGYGRYDLP